VIRWLSSQEAVADGEARTSGGGTDDWKFKFMNFSHQFQTQVTEIKQLQRESARQKSPQRPYSATAQDPSNGIPASLLLSCSLRESLSGAFISEIVHNAAIHGPEGILHVLLSRSILCVFLLG
jgi:hypothetical protein